MPEGIKTIVNTRKARHEFFIEIFDRYCPHRTRLNPSGANLHDSYAVIKDGEVFHGLHISPYDQGNRFNQPGESPKLF